VVKNTGVVKKTGVTSSHESQKHMRDKEVRGKKKTLKIRSKTTGVGNSRIAMEMTNKTSRT
jgi:hypothetical protein